MKVCLDFLCASRALVLGLALGSAVEFAEADSIAKRSCAQPTTGSYVGSCQALSPGPDGTLAHVLDKWIMCEMDSGAHGTVGYGLAVFLSEQAVTAWNNEITLYLSQLEMSLPAKAVKKLREEQKLWEKSRPSREAKVTRNYAKSEGTLAMVRWAADISAIPRKRALVLGCRLEKIEG